MGTSRKESPPNWSVIILLGLGPTLSKQTQFSALREIPVQTTHIFASNTFSKYVSPCKLIMKPTTALHFLCAQEGEFSFIFFSCLGTSLHDELPCFLMLLYS